MTIGLWIYIVMALVVAALMIYKFELRVSNMPEGREEKAKCVILFLLLMAAWPVTLYILAIDWFSEGI